MAERRQEGREYVINLAYAGYYKKEQPKIAGKQNLNWTLQTTIQIESIITYGF